jgi:hypothetical protein
LPCFVFFAGGSEVDGLAAELAELKTRPRLLLLTTAVDEVPVEDVLVVATSLSSVTRDIASADAWIHTLLRPSMCTMKVFFSPLIDPADVHALYPISTMTAKNK